MYEEKAVLGPLRVRIVVVVVAAAAAGPPDDGGRALPIVGGLAVAGASAGPPPMRCGGAAGEPDEYSPVDLGSTLMWGSFGSTGITASGWVFFMCRSMFPRSTYDLLHCGQWWFFSPVCDRWCDTRWPLQIKSFGHMSHRNGRSMGWPFVWLRWWNSRLPLSGNDLPHSSHWNGRSPV